ncbi:MAG: IS110 family transposase [Candidatus Odinarchaeota archaeon]
MKKPVYEACGIDVHKENLVVRVITRDLERNEKWTVKNTGTSIRLLIKQLQNYGVEKVGFESTGSYWELLHDLLEPHFDVTLANARQTRALPGDPKTDGRDALWIAKLLARGMLRKSYVPPQDQRQLRGLCRLKASLKKELTRYLNKQHVLLDRWDINFAGMFSQIDTQVCQYLLKKRSEGKTLDGAIAEAPDKRKVSKLESKREELARYFAREFPEVAGIELGVLCDIVASHQQQINRLETVISQLATRVGLDEKTEVIEEIYGIGRDSAIALLVETGEMEKFATGRQLVAWSGLNPFVYQSAGKNYTGKITKCGNKHVRRILHNSARICVKDKNSALYEFYERVKKRQGGPRALVALMAKLLRVIHVLLTKGVKYERYPQKVKKRSVARAV